MKIKKLGRLFVLLILFNAIIATTLAQQFTFFDTEREWKNGKGYVPYNRGQDDWRKPYDYVNGTMYLRYEVIEKPSSIECEMQMGIWQLTGKETPVYNEMIAKVRPSFTGTGVIYANLKSPGSWHKVGDRSIDWGREFHHTEVLLKAGRNLLRTTWCGSHCYEGGDIDKHIPIKYHATAILVAEGETLNPPQWWENCPDGWGCGEVAATKYNATIASRQENIIVKNRGNEYRIVLPAQRNPGRAMIIDCAGKHIATLSGDTLQDRAAVYSFSRDKVPAAGVYLLHLAFPTGVSRVIQLQCY